MLISLKRRPQAAQGTGSRAHQIRSADRGPRLAAGRENLTNAMRPSSRVSKPSPSACWITDSLSDILSGVRIKIAGSKVANGIEGYLANIASIDRKLAIRRQILSAVTTHRARNCRLRSAQPQVDRQREKPATVEGRTGRLASRWFVGLQRQWRTASADREA